VKAKRSASWRISGVGFDEPEYHFCCAACSESTIGLCNTSPCKVVDLVVWSRAILNRKNAKNPGFQARAPKRGDTPECESGLSC
jgi:hypothetical protein